MGLDRFTSKHRGIRTRLIVASIFALVFAALSYQMTNIEHGGKIAMLLSSCMLVFFTLTRDGFDSAAERNNAPTNNAILISLGIYIVVFIVGSVFWVWTDTHDTPWTITTLVALLQSLPLLYLAVAPARMKYEG